MVDVPFDTSQASPPHPIRLNVREVLAVHLIGLFNSRRRLMHDIILGTVVINSSIRTRVTQPARTF